MTIRQRVQNYLYDTEKNISIRDDKYKCSRKLASTFKKSKLAFSGRFKNKSNLRHIRNKRLVWQPEYAQSIQEYGCSDL